MCKTQHVILENLSICGFGYIWVGPRTNCHTDSKGLLYFSEDSCKVWHSKISLLGNFLSMAVSIQTYTSGTCISVLLLIMNLEKMSQEKMLA